MRHKPDARPVSRPADHASSTRLPAAPPPPPGVSPGGASLPGRTSPVLIRRHYAAVGVPSPGAGCPAGRCGRPPAPADDCGDTAVLRSRGCTLTSRAEFVRVCEEAGFWCKLAKRQVTECRIVSFALASPFGASNQLRATWHGSYCQLPGLIWEDERGSWVLTDVGEGQR